MADRAPVVAVVGQCCVHDERAPIHRARSLDVVADDRRNHVRHEKLGPLVGGHARHLRRDAAQRGVGPQRAVGDLHREVEHFVAQRREINRGQRPAKFLIGAHRRHVVADVGERLARRDSETLRDRAVAHPDAEGEPAARDFVDVRRSVARLDRVREVDRLNRREVAQRRGRVRERGTQRHRRAETRTRDVGEAEVLRLRGECEYAGASCRRCDERDGRSLLNEGSSHGRRVTQTPPYRERGEYDDVGAAA